MNSFNLSEATDSKLGLTGTQAETPASLEGVGTNNNPNPKDALSASGTAEAADSNSLPSAVATDAKIPTELQDLIPKAAPDSENIESLSQKASPEIAAIGADTTRRVSLVYRFVENLSSKFGELWETAKDKISSLFSFSK